VPIRYTRGPDSQYAKTLVEVPVHLLDPSLGTVRLYLRELPAGLYQELEDGQRDGGDPLDVARQIVRYGVAGHVAEDFVGEAEDGTYSPIPYQGDTLPYGDRVLPVVSEETLRLYEHALPRGLFLYSVRTALRYYMGGLVPTPQQIWDSARPATGRPLSEVESSPETSTSTASSR
jgi:hypothetical protein